MGGIKLQLLCGVRIELAVGSLPYLALAGYPSRSLPHATFCIKKGCYKHANPLDLRLNLTRGLPTTGSRIWGPFKQTRSMNDLGISPTHLPRMLSIVPEMIKMVILSHLTWVQSKSDTLCILKDIGEVLDFDLIFLLPIS